MPVQAKIHVPPITPVDLQPVDIFRGSFVRQSLQHVAPGTKGHLSAPLQGTGHGLNAQAHGAFQIFRILVQPVFQPLLQLLQRGQDAGQCGIERFGRFQQPVHWRMRVRLHRIGAVRLLGAGINLRAHQCQETLRLALCLALGDPGQPALAR